MSSLFAIPTLEDMSRDSFKPIQDFTFIKHPQECWLETWKLLQLACNTTSHMDLTLSSRTSIIKFQTCSIELDPGIKIHINYHHCFKYLIVATCVVLQNILSRVLMIFQKKWQAALATIALVDVAHVIKSITSMLF